MKQFTIARLTIIDGYPELIGFKEVFNSRAEANTAVKDDIIDMANLSNVHFKDFSKERGGKFVYDGGDGLHIEYLVTMH